MTKLQMNPTYKLPSVLFDPVTNIFEIKGHSIPENAIDCYAPIFNWFDDYFDEIPHQKIELNFNLEYVNSASTRMLIMLFSKLESLSEGKKEIIVNWHCEDNEDDIDIAKLYRATTGLKFNLIPHKDSKNKFL